MSLYENINRRRKLGVSRSKADSTISKGSYSNMKKGFPEKAKKGKLIEEKGAEIGGEAGFSIYEWEKKERFSRCFLLWRQSNGQI